MCDDDPKDDDDPDLESPSELDEADVFKDDERCPLRLMLSMPSGSKMQSSSPASKCDRSPGVDETEDTADDAGEAEVVVGTIVGVDGPLLFTLPPFWPNNTICWTGAAGNLLFVITFSACIGSVMVSLNLLLMIKFVPLIDFLFDPDIVAFIWF